MLMACIKAGLWCILLNQPITYIHVPENTLVHFIDAAVVAWDILRWHYLIKGQAVHHWTDSQQNYYHLDHRSSKTLSGKQFTARLT